ncbi:MAG: hypothetical protein ACXACF_09270 [Candidatus Hermodarchaeia archaeon]|jgi:hypothetical protein
MRLQAIGKNIELPNFCGIVERFFTEQKYQSSRHPIKNGYYVVGRPISIKDKRPNVAVVVEGEPNKFTIEILHMNPESVSPGTRIGAFLIGTFAGLEIRKAAENQDQFIRFEKLFWDYVRKSIAEISKT